MKKGNIFLLLITPFFLCANEETHSLYVEGNSSVEKNYLQAENSLILGDFEYIVGENLGKIESFKDGYNDITITDDQVVVRVKDLNGVNFILTLRGNGVAENPIHNYIPAPTSTSDTDYTAMIMVSGFEEMDIINPYTWKSGELTILEYNSADGTLKGEISGEGGKTRDIKNENPVTFTGKFNMKFTTVVDYREK
jgi:hypothetical protein